MPRRKTHEEFVSELSKININIEVLEAYKNNHTKIKCKCKICNYEWSTQGKHLLNGSGCPSCAGVIKKTTVSFIDEFNKINNNIEILGKYKNNHTKIKCKCLIDNHIWEPTPNTLLRGEGCPECKKRTLSKIKSKSHNKFLLQVKEKNPDIIVLGKYINSETKIKCKCKIDGYIWETLPNTILNGSKCPKCTKHYHRNNKDFVKELYEINNNVTPIIEFVKIHNKIKCLCNICNYIWEVTPHSLLQGYGCPICGHENAKKLTRKSHENFISDLKDVNENIEVIDKYINNKTKIQCRCKLCGNTWMAIPNNLLSNHGCPICSKSNGENIIKDFLLKNDILYLPQYRFKDLRGINNGMLSYDFYLPNRNTLIEFQGKQHDIPIDFFGGKKQLRVQQEHDKRKRDYAKKHKIELLEIWYYDIDNIEKILENKLIRQYA